MTRWGEIDPVSAAEYASGLESRRMRDTAISSILGQWGKTDPASAFRWLSGLPDADVASLRPGVRTLFRQMANADHMWALEQVWGLPTGATKTTALQSVLDQIGRQDVDQTELMRQYQQLPAGDDKTLFAQQIVDAWTRYQPELAASWIDTLTDPQSQAGAIMGPKGPGRRERLRGRF